MRWLSEQIQYTSSQKYKRNVYIQITKGHHIKQRKEYQQGLGVIYHELSHHLTLQITAGRPPIWFNEGLAEYFEHCKVNKKGLQHTFTITKKEESALYICWGTLICSPLSTAAKRNLEAAKNRRTIRLYPLSCTRHFLDRESSPADIT